MNRSIAAAVIATLGLVAGYAAQVPRVSAQASYYPFTEGDTIRFNYPGATLGPCVIDHFYGSFVSCKPESRPFGPPVANVPEFHNLSTVWSVELVKKAQ